MRPAPRGGRPLRPLCQQPGGGGGRLRGSALIFLAASMLLHVVCLWHLPVTAWNKLQHALHGNGVHGHWSSGHPSAVAPTLMWTSLDAGGDENLNGTLGKLYAGPAETALDWAGERQAMVVNVVDKGFPYDERCRRTWLVINYKGTVNNTTWEQRAFAAFVLILHGLAMGWDVLVHCRVGKHRTGCMVISLLILLHYHMWAQLPWDEIVERAWWWYFYLHPNSKERDFESRIRSCLAKNKLFDYMKTFAVDVLPNIQSYRTMITAIRMCGRSRSRECLRCQSSGWLVCGWKAARRKLNPLEKWMTFVRGVRSLPTIHT